MDGIEDHYPFLDRSPVVRAVQFNDFEVALEGKRMATRMARMGEGWKW